METFDGGAGHGGGALAGVLRRQPIAWRDTAAFFNAVARRNTMVPECLRRLCSPVFALSTMGALVLTGCGILPGSVEHYQRPAAPIVAAVVCPGLLSENGSIPYGFEPVSAVVCSVTAVMTPSPDGVSQSGLVEIHYAGDLGPLLTAAREPSDRVAGGVVCPAVLFIPSALWLVDASGRAILLARPTDVCGQPKPGVDQALGTLTVVQTINRGRPAPGHTPSGSPATSKAAP